MKTPEEEMIATTLGKLGRPASYFSGLTLRHSLAPDNILFFRQTDVRAFQPEGVTDNYHHRFELLLTIEGGGPVRIGESGYLLHGGEGALIFPHQFHHYMDVEPGPMQWLFITFELENAKALRSLRDSPRVLDPWAWPLLAGLLEEYTRNDRPADPLLISCRLAGFLRAMLDAPRIPKARRQLHGGDPTRDLLLEKINQHVRSHLGEALSIEKLAQAIGYSASHVRSVFRNRLGISLGRYMRESRLAEAAQLLHGGEKMSIAEVARLSGFDSPFSFSRAFKNAYGFSPRAYSKRLTPQSTTPPHLL